MPSPHSKACAARHLLDPFGILRSFAIKPPSLSHRGLPRALSREHCLGPTRLSLRAPAALQDPLGEQRAL